ncbi:glycosyltransferase family 2 protein [Constantimarinum furrinae]|uniref:TuaG n=1 Tax=Constantimarinum furrinae TaxID=2562285 RepID=A0A7G8PT05_9FLAO|nr:glycosyltransferase family 2 protein [Constantimarinum furrinae]QNJ97471.1 TuaG [Constantimarinum furrinae]
MKNKPLVSVITPLYNAEGFIAHTIASIQKQTYTQWELILVDDASTDTSLKIAKSHAKEDPRIKVFSIERNEGAAYCRNYATRLATGEYIAFLDADDLWHSQKLEIQLQFMQQNDCAVSFTSYLHIDELGNSLHKRIVALPKLSYAKQHRNNYIGNLTGMYSVEKLGKIEAPKIRKRQDWAVWLEAIDRSGKPALGIDQDLAYYRVRKGSISANKSKLIKYNYRFYRTYLGYNPLKAFYNLCLFFVEYFFVRPKYIQKKN